MASRRRIIVNSPQMALFPEPEVLDLFLLIAPSVEAVADTQYFKQISLDKIGDFDSYHSKAHISLGIIKTTSELIVQNLEQIKERLIHLPYFKVHLNGFGVFKSGSKGTIYINVANKEQIIAIHQWLFPNKRSFAPHITIAKNLPEKHLNNLWSYFATLSYQKSFICDKITLLIRHTDSDEVWKSYGTIPLKPTNIV